MSAALKAKIVRVNIEYEAVGAYFATSPDLKGLLVVKNTLEELTTEIPLSIQALYLACGEDVVALPAEGGNDDPAVQSWVKISAGVCRELEAAGH